jgi:hypothetical protein
VPEKPKKKLNKHLTCRISLFFLFHSPFSASSPRQLLTICLAKSLKISLVNVVKPTLQPATDFSSTEKRCSHSVSSNEIRLSNSTPIDAMRLGSIGGAVEDAIVGGSTSL